MVLVKAMAMIVLPSAWAHERRMADNGRQLHRGFISFRCFSTGWISPGASHNKGSLDPRMWEHTTHMVLPLDYLSCFWYLQSSSVSGGCASTEFVEPAAGWEPCVPARQVAPPPTRLLGFRIDCFFVVLSYVAFPITCQKAPENMCRHQSQYNPASILFLFWLIGALAYLLFVCWMIREATLYYVQNEGGGGGGSKAVWWRMASLS